ncbi:MAG: UDP-N-acetylmuramoyl-tripeptide--D-alanyl-D-alanine ligase [Bacteroidales bacterium]|nr:UDP-N-acetylmuramoyl-tripeptide--D-alanyl-D-alanine ligase [Bacteroidales bacterium]
MRSEDFYNIFLQHPQICTDSRKVFPGCLYFSLKGEHFDGNAFAADALSKGCACAIVDDPAVVADERYVLVPDVLTFMQELASYHRSLLTIPVIGLTGTNGKTTTKELIQSVLKQKYLTIATSGNLNNHIGVPLTVLSANAETEILIVEMGANHPGEIDFLCHIARPTHGLITNIGKAHLEGFGSFEGVIRTKNELYSWIKSTGGKLFVNTDDPLLNTLVKDYPSVSYGVSATADISGSALNMERNLSVIWETADGGPEMVNSHLTGGYNLQNILAAISVGRYFGLSNDQIRVGIESYIPENMRSQWIQTDHNVLFLDAYNANPSSMALSIDHFASLHLPDSVAILGDMFELGVYSDEEHLNIIKLAETKNFGRLLFAGRNFFSFKNKYPFLFFEDIGTLKGYLEQNQISGCQILIKGSRGMKLEQLVPYL